MGAEGTLEGLAGAVRRGEVSARDLVARSLDRIERLDRDVNAVILVRGEAAIADAAALDERIAAGEGPGLGPLAGLPLLVKDTEDCAGLPTTSGSLLRADGPPAVEDAGQVRRLSAAGAIVVGKTNVPEFAFEGFTANRLFGVTRNPWAPDWSPGGSSGGSGAALSMGLAPLATATDGGGSVRIPAAFCGLAGLKPTNGLVPREPVPSWMDLSTSGPLATSIADLRLLLGVLRGSGDGPTPGDPATAPVWRPRPGDARPARLLVTTRLCDHGPLPDGVAASWEAAIPRLEAALGLPAEPIDPPLQPRIDEDWFVTVAVEELTSIGRDVVRQLADELTSYLRGAFEAAEEITLDDYLAARRRRFEATRTIDLLLGDDALLATPTMCVEGFLADGRMSNTSEEPGTESPAYNTQVANITGHPALSLPAGISANGVPFGIQVTGPRYADDLVLAAGGVWEAAQPWPLAAPGYEPFPPV